MSSLNDSFEEATACSSNGNENNDIDDEDNANEFYDSETEPSILVDYDTSLNLSADCSMLNQSFGNQSFQQQDRIYYAVQFMDKAKVDKDCSTQIFVKREKALKLCKKYATNARFKVFRCFNEAYSFSYDLDVVSVKQENGGKSSEDAEKLPFPKPSTRELNEFRSFIEKNDLASIKKKLVNPRYLISAGDSPVIIKESCRYNSLHICAIQNSLEICEHIMKTLSDVNFVKALYFNDTIEQAKCRTIRLLDLYLNTPEKGFHETPLHFACKYGSFEIVDLFLKQEPCSKTVKNKQDQVPADLICAKYNKGDRELLAAKIRSLFEDCFYVPFVMDNDILKVTVSMPCKDEKINEMKTASPSDTCRSKKLTAFVGPTSPIKANLIYERMKSPSSMKRSPNHKEIIDILRSDDYKGYERVGRKMCEEVDVPWVEYWDFLGCYCNLKTHDGLSKLESFLIQKKFETYLNNQIRSCERIKVILSLSKGSALCVGLDQFLSLINTLKDELGLRECCLSEKFDNTQRIKERIAKFNDKLKEELKTQFVAAVGNAYDEFYQKIEFEFNLTGLAVLVQKYLKDTIELMTVDTSGIVYFYLYKSTKIIIELLNYKDFVNDSFLTAFFKKVESKKSLFYEKHFFKRTDSCNSEDSSLKDALRSLKIDDKYRERVDDLCGQLSQIKCCDDDDEYADLIRRQRLNRKQYNGAKVADVGYESNSNGTSDDDGEEADQKTGENLCKFFNRITYLSNKSNVSHKLFIYGNTPTKIDCAVYFAIKDVTTVNQDLYPTLHEWFNFMKKYKISDMKSWKTPMRKSNFN